MTCIFEKGNDDHFAILSVHNLVKVVRGNPSNIQAQINNFLETTEHTLLDIKLTELTGQVQKIPRNKIILDIFCCPSDILKQTTLQKPARYFSDTTIQAC